MTLFRSSRPWALSLIGAASAAFLLIAPPAHAADLSSLIRVQTAGASPPAIDVNRFYALRDFRPAWDEKDMDLALRVLAQSASEGLDPAEYYPGSKPSRATEQEMAAWDVRLTSKVLQYAHDVRLGRLAPGQVYGDIELRPQKFDAPQALQAALAAGTLSGLISDLPPQRPEYAFLRETLARYRAIYSLGEWPRLPDGKGEVSALPSETQHVLRLRLAAEDATASTDQLERALRRFQARQGLEADGRLGPRTIAALNIPAHLRIEQVEANMERWRWMPHRAQLRYVEVNAAGASLTVFENAKAVLVSRIVAGKPKSPTPILATDIVAVTANPPWNVPQSIARKEILPKLIRNPGYLSAQNMVLRNGPANAHGIDWRNVSRSRFPYNIQQLPGDKNALGRLKMEMPNRFDVYLHDTPSKSLFAQSDRFFSHGCVRVQQVGELAKYALTGDPSADVARILQPADDKTDRVALAQPLPVYILYWTVFRDVDGSVAFRRDIYGRDSRLIAALNGKRMAVSMANLPTPCGG